MKVLNTIDYDQNQAKNIVVDNRSQPISEPKKGQIYFNTEDSRLYYYSGEKWIGMDAKDVVSFINSNKALIKIEKVDRLQKLLDSKETPSGAQSKADGALAAAKSYTDEGLKKLVGLAPEEYDTLLELLELIKSNDKNINQLLVEGLAKKTNKYSKYIGDGIGLQHKVTHNLNSKDVIVTINQNSLSGAVVLADIDIIDANNIVVKFSKPPKSNEYRVTVIG